MSSILDALKKAEQESTADRGAGTPWPAPLPAQSSYRQSTRRWWVPLGIVVVLGVSGVIFWQIRRPDATRPADSVTAAPRSHKIHDSAPPSVVQAPDPNMPTVEKKPARPTETVLEATAPLAEVPPAKSPKKPPPAARPAAVPMVQPPALPLEKTQRQAAVSKPDPVIVPPAAPIRRPAETAEEDRQPTPEPPDRDKTFRSDPRIDLQALVWAPQAAARFVVINNRLIKEGGSLDNIVVVRINQDDVLLAEGSDRWHEEFKVR